MIKYRWTDAWLLGAIANTSKNRPAELWEIIAEGDNLNHALFTDEEIESGLTRLTKGGWIKESNGSFTTTDKFKTIQLNIRNYESVLKLQKIMDAEPWYKGEPVPHPENNLKYPGLTQEKLVQANKKYRKFASGKY